MVATCTIPLHLAHIPSAEEYLAVLAAPGPFDRLLRKDDLLDVGVAAVFGLVNGEAELLALCFHCRNFTLPQAAAWLAERGFASSATPEHRWT